MTAWQVFVVKLHIVSFLENMGGLGVHMNAASRLAIAQKSLRPLGMRSAVLKAWASEPF